MPKHVRVHREQTDQEKRKRALQRDGLGSYQARTAGDGTSRPRAVHKRVGLSLSQQFAPHWLAVRRAKVRQIASATDVDRHRAVSHWPPHKVHAIALATDVEADHPRSMHRPNTPDPIGTLPFASSCAIRRSCFLSSMVRNSPSAV